MLAGAVLMALLSAAPAQEDTRARCEEGSALVEFDEESLLHHPYWREWVAGTSYTRAEMGGYEELQMSFELLHELPTTPPRFRAPLALPPPLTGTLTVTLAPGVRKREEPACIHLAIHTDSDRPKLRSLRMEEAPLELRAQVWNAGLPVLDVTWEAHELTYVEDDPPGRRLLIVPHPQAPRSGYPGHTRILLGDARAATMLLERPPASSDNDEAYDFEGAHEDLLTSLAELGLSWEQLLRIRPPKRVSSAWRQLVLEMISQDLSGPLDPRDPTLARKARKLEALAAIQVDARAEPLWHPLRRAWTARLRPPPSKPSVPMGQVELSIAPAEKERPVGALLEVWLDGQRILCPACPDPAFQGVTTRRVAVPPGHAARLWMRWEELERVRESEEWVPLLPGHRYLLRPSWYFHSASEQGVHVSIELESGAPAEQPACVTVEAAGQAAPGLAWAVSDLARQSEQPLPRVQPIAFGALRPGSPKQRLAIVPARGDTALTHSLWTLLPVRYLSAGTYRFVLEQDGSVRLRFSPEQADCTPTRH